MFDTFTHDVRLRSFHRVFNGVESLFVFGERVECLVSFHREVGALLLQFREVRRERLRFGVREASCSVRAEIPVGSGVSRRHRPTSSIPYTATEQAECVSPITTIREIQIAHSSSRRTRCTMR